MQKRLNARTRTTTITTLCHHPRIQDVCPDTSSSVIDRSQPSVCNSCSSALLISRAVKIRACRAHFEFPRTESFVYCGGLYKVSVRFYWQWYQTFVARMRAAMKILSCTNVSPKESGSRCALARFRYVSATKSVETLDREEVITEQMKCLNSHVGRLPGEAWSG